MSSKRVFFAMCGILVILIGLIVGAAFSGNILLQKRSEKLSQLKINQKALQQQQVLLLQAKRDVDRYTELNQIARAIVPQDKDQAKTVREINAIAAQNNVALKSIDFEASNLGDKAAAAPATNGEEAAASKQTKAPPLSQVKPVSGIKGVYSLEIRVTSASEVSYIELIGFLEGLEHNRRTAHVTKVDLTPTENGLGIKFIITLNAYIKP